VQVFYGLVHDGPENQIRSLQTIHSLTGLPVVADGAVRTQPLHSLLPVLAKFGLSMGDLLEEIRAAAGTCWRTPIIRFKLTDAARLLALCAKRTKCPHLGLLAGQQVPSTQWGRSDCWRNGTAVSVRPCCGVLIRTLHLHDRAIIPTLSVSGGTAMLSLAPHRYLAVGGDQVGDFTLAVAFNLVCGLLRIDPTWRAKSTWPTTRRPIKDRTTVLRAFGGIRLRSQCLGIPGRVAGASPDPCRDEWTTPTRAYRGRGAWPATD